MSCVSRRENKIGVVDHLVLLPEDALVLLLAADLLVVVELLRHLLRHRGLPLHSDLFDDVCIIYETSNLVTRNYRLNSLSVLLKRLNSS